jgi:uncharacterized 2Fe-2S/4Fe-4S cluster protein (DUF4445 family)
MTGSLGIAVDLGTTTVVAELVDLASGHVLGVRSDLNPQAFYGSDIMCRLRFPGPLTQLIRKKIGQFVSELSASGQVRDIVIVGNTAMHHLFCGIDVEPLRHAPFVSARDGLEILHASELRWDIPEEIPVRFLPCLGGFVGSDILAGIVATGMDQSEALVGLVDLGTNGEIVFGNRERMVCASTAAGPAFEAGRITMGMRATTGAIAAVRSGPTGPVCHVLGDVPPRGICGSGLVDAVAVGLDMGVIAPSGRLAHNWTLAPSVSLTQSDVRELQLAKAAIAAGIRILLRRWGATATEVTRLHLAGAFGNYVDPASARRIGLFGLPAGLVRPAGNAALQGAKIALFRDFADLRRRVKHISLAADPDFQEIYVEEMPFPATSG